MAGKGKNIIVELTFEFSLDLIVFTELLTEQKKFGLSKQLFCSGTSVGANVQEAQASESSADFIHKMKVALKEAEETKYWLRLCEASPFYPSPGDLLEKIQVILKIINSIITSARR